MPEKGGMVGLAGFEPAISWVPGETGAPKPRGLSGRIEDIPGPLDLAIRQPRRSPPKCDVALALTFTGSVNLSSDASLSYP